MCVRVCARARARVCVCVLPVWHGIVSVKLKRNAALKVKSKLCDEFISPSRIYLRVDPIKFFGSIRARSYLDSQR